MGVKNLQGLAFKMGRAIAKLRAAFLEGLYSVHIKVRYLHDVTYHKGGWYKKYSDKAYSDHLHKTTMAAFALSFIVFSLMQSVFPYLFNVGKPQTARAGANSKTWTTQADFTNNNGQTGDITSSNINQNNGDPKINFDSASITDDSANIETVTIGTQTWMRKNLNVGTMITVATAQTNNAVLEKYCFNNLESNCTTDGGLYQWGETVQYLNGASNTTSPSPAFSGNVQGICPTGFHLPTDAELKTLEMYMGMTQAEADATGWRGTTQGDRLKITGLCQGRTPCGTSGYSGLLPGNVLGGSFLYQGSDGSFWSSSEDSATYAWRRYLYLPNATVNRVSKSKTYGLSVRCLANTADQAGGGANSHTLTSSVKDGTRALDFTTLSWTETKPANTDIVMEFRAGNTAVPDGSWQTWSAITQGGSISAFAGSRYFQYRAVLSSTVDSSSATLGVVTINYNTYLSPASLGGVSAGNIGLRADAGEGAKAKANTLTWTGTTAASGQKILFKVRTGNTQTELDTNQCYGPTTLDSGCADWTTAGKFFSQIYGESNSATTIPSGIAPKRYIEVLVRLDSSGADSPTLSDVTLTYDTLDAPLNANIVLTRADSTSLMTNTGGAVTGGVAGAWINQSTLRVTANSLGCSGCGIPPTGLRPEVEAKIVGTAFDGTNTFTAVSGNIYVDVLNLAAGVTYHIRVRAIDDQGRVSAWTSYGNNTESDADISVDETAPTGTVQINAGAQYANSVNVTLNLSATDVGGSSVSQMRFSNDNSTWSTWETYATSKAWALSSGDGEKTVYTQFKDNAGTANSGTLMMHPTGDTYLYDSMSLTNYGASTMLPLKSKTANMVQRTIFRYDFSSKIPSGATIDLATFSPYWYNESSETSKGGVLEVNRMLATGWGEGTQNGQEGLTGDATWHTMAVPTSWPGSVGAATVETDYTVTDQATYTIPSNDVVGKWIDFNVKNQILTAQSIAGSVWNARFAFAPSTDRYFGMLFYSRESALIDKRPKLAINYTMPVITDTISLDVQVPTGSMTIGNGNPGAVNNKAVTLYLDPTTPEPGGAGVKEFQLSNDGTNWGTAYDPATQTYSGTWQTWSDTYKTGGAGYSWNLIKGVSDAGSDGVRTVSIKYKDNAGNIGGNYNPNYINGLSGTPLAGKYVYNVSTGSGNQWGPGGVLCPTGTGGNQPCEVGIDPNYPSKSVLVSPQTYPYIDFSAYTLQYACKAIGGRMPNMQELLAIYNSQSSYGNNFNQYWTYSATEYNNNAAYTVHFGTGVIDGWNKGNTFATRCVSDNNPALVSDTVNLDTVVPSASSVTGISANPNNTGNQTVTWSVFSDTAPSSNFQKYVVQRKISGGTYSDIKTETTQGTTSYADNANLNEGTYYYRVIVYDNANNSTTSSDSSALIVDKAAPTGEVTIAREIGALADGMMNSDTSYGDNALMKIADGPGSAKVRSLLRFKLNEVIPSGATITGAAVSVYHDVPDTGTASAAGKSIYLYRMTQTGWVENQFSAGVYKTGSPWSARWAEGDYTTQNGQSYTFPSGDKKWFTISGSDLSNQIQYAVTNNVAGEMRADMIMRFATEGMPSENYSSLRLFTRDYTGDMYTPKLYVSYTLPSGSYVKSTSVNLINSASDTGGSELSQMRFSNDNTNWSTWETYSVIKAWTLSSGDGPKTVYAQFKDSAGNTRQAFGKGKMRNSPVSDWQATPQGDHYGNFYDAVTNTWATIDRAGPKTIYDPNTRKIYDVPAGYVGINPRSDGKGGYEAIVEGAGTNYLKNSTFIDNNSNGRAEAWDLWSNVSGAFTYSISSSSVYGNSSQRAVYTSISDTSKNADIKSSTDVGSFAPTEAAYATAYLKGSNIGTNIRLRLTALDLNSQFIATSYSSYITLTDSWTPYTHFYTNLPAGTSRVTFELNIGGIDTGDSIDVSLSGAQLEKGEYVTSFIPTPIASTGSRIRDLITVPTTSWKDYTGTILTTSAGEIRPGTHTITRWQYDFGNFISLGLYNSNYYADLTANNVGYYATSGVTADYRVLGLTYNTGTPLYLWKNGVKSGPTANTETPLNLPNYANIGSTGNQNYYGGPIQRVVIYDNVLSDPDIVAVTNALNDTPATTVLDTQPPTAFSLSSPVNNTWATNSNPTFYWNSSTGHDRYQLWLNGTLNKDNISPGAISTTAQAQLTEGNYAWTIKAVDNAGNITGASETWNYGYDATIPGRITGFLASINDISKIGLSWNAHVDTGSPVDNYKMERVKYLEYVAHSMSPTGDWGTGEGYANFIFSNSTTTFDDDPTNPQQGQVAVETSVKYTYRIRVKDVANADYSLPQESAVYGMTQDGKPPDDVTGVDTVACDGTVQNCFNIANKGFEIKITWNASVDVGSGVAKYNVYRAITNPSEPASYEAIGETVSPGLVFYDNDSVHGDPLKRLNDFSTYYYRVTAVDASENANESNLFPMLDPTTNADSTRTPDVTAPSTPLAVTATPMGIDPSGSMQRVNIVWTSSSDTRARSNDAGSGVKEYKILRATSENGTYSLVGTVASGLETSYNNDGLDEFTDFWYKVKAVDNYSNESNLSTPSSVKTASNAVPTVPTNVTVISKKGDSNTDPEVGHKVTISYKGSYSKNCLNDVRCVVKYEVYRSTTNWASASDWLDGSKATLVKEENVATLSDDRDTTYTFDDTNLTDATTYYYKARTLDNTPSVPDGGPFYSGLSVVSTGTLYAGWDITPDATPPTPPSELKVKDIHDDGLNFKRNIITWKRLAAPLRNGQNDFREYRLYRSNDGLSWTQILINGLNPLFNADKEVSISNNYYIDLIPISESNQYYFYYVTAADDAGASFVYPSPNNNTVINGTANESKPETDSQGNIVSVSLNPAIAKPTINTITSGEYTGYKAAIVEVGVSSAVVSWTTDQPTDSIVEYKVKGSSDAFIGTINRSLVLNHQITVRPLLPNTEYDYRVISRNYLANDAIASDSELPPLTTTGFNITLGAVVTTTTTSEINWSTNLNSSSAFIEYQLQRTPGDEPQSGVAGSSQEALAASPRNHKVIIKGLRSARTYTYKIKSISSDGFLSEYPAGEFANFRTKSFDSDQFTLTPASSNVAERNITSTSAQIIWQTSTATTSWVDYGTASGVYDVSAGNNDLNTYHVVLLEGLMPGTKYYYRARVRDINEVEFTSQEYTFTAVLKPKISELKIAEITPYSVTISWITNIETETLINWGKTEAYGEKRGSTQKTRSHVLLIDNLDDNTEYHYQILARDQVGQEVADSDKVVRTPLDISGPKILEVKTELLPLNESDATASAIISWKTDKPATTLVQYDPGLIGAKLTKSSIEDSSLSNSHTVIIKDLDPGTTYRFRITSRDKRGNSTTSNDYNFITPTVEKSILQLILKSLEETFSWVANIGQFFRNIGKKSR